MRLVRGVLAVAAFSLAASCSDATPSATPIQPEAVIELARQATSDTPFAVDRTTTWTLFNRATGERKVGSETEALHWSGDGDFAAITIFDEGNGPVRSERRCVDGQRYTYHEGFGWEASSSSALCASDRSAVVNAAIVDATWTSEPQTVEVDGRMVLRLTGEKLETDVRDGQPDPSSFTLTTVRLDLDPVTYRIVEVESVARSYVGEDSWGIEPPVGEPLSTFTVVTKFSTDGEPVLVEVPEGVE